MVEHLFSVCKALGSIPNTAKMGWGGGGVVRSGVSLMEVLVAAAPGLGKPLTCPSLTFPPWQASAQVSSCSEWV